MAAPTLIYPVHWPLRITNDMATQVRLAAASDGVAREAWVREAVQQRLDRKRKAKR
jgi:predicted HicB family RNase H-like nuclease